MRFAGRAYVLPKSAEASVPIVSVNAGEAALRLYRVGTRNVATVIGNGDFGSPLTGGEETRAAATPWARRSGRGPGELAQELNRDVTTTLPMGDVVAGLEPGLYALTARVADGPAREDWEASATQWFVVTDLGLAALTGADGLHVFLRGLSDAGAREGVEVTLLARNNDVLGRAVTDAEGHARFDPGLLRGRGGAEAALVTAEAGQDFAFLSLAEPGFDLSDRGVAGRPAPPPVDVFVTTERGAYRPGETVFATVLARDDRARAIEGLTLTAIVTRADGVEYGRFPLPDQGAGGRALTLPIDAGAPTGGWRLAVHADPEAPPLASAAFLVEDFTPERVDLALTLPEGPVDPAAPPTLEARADFLWGAPGAELALEGETTVAMARELPGRPGFVFGLEDEPFVSGYAALPAATTDADGAARDPAGAAGGRAGEPAAGADRDAAGARRVGAAGRAQRDPAAAVGGAADRGAPALRGSGGRGRHRRLRGDRARAAISRPRTSPPSSWTLSRIETDFQWYEADGVWNYEPVTRRSRVANGTVDLAAAAPVRLDMPVDWGRYELTLAATDGRYIATSIGLRRRLGRGRGGLGDAGLPRAEPRPRSLCPRRHGAGADRRAEPRAAPGRGDGRPADRDPHARRRGRRDGHRSAGNRGLGRRRLCDGDADPADGRRRRTQPGAGDRPRLGPGRSGATPPRRRLRGPGRGRAAERHGGGAEDRRAPPRASAPMPPSPRSISAS